MIRPLTIATCLLACGSGLYLYQSKHEVQLLDRTIERTVHDTTALREQSRLLAAEWNMLNDPERLRQFSDTYLTLKSIDPKQYTSLADLDTRLPAPEAETPADGTDEQNPAPVVSEAAPPVAPDTDIAPDVVADAELPVPPIPSLPPAPVVATITRPAEIRTSDRTPAPRPAVPDTQTRPVAVADRAIDQHPVDQRPPEQHVAMRAPEVRPQVASTPRPIILAARRPVPANVPVNQAPAQYRPPMVAASPYGGSLLGMARGSMPPAPRPTPVNAAYNSN